MTRATHAHTMRLSIRRDGTGTGKKRGDECRVQRGLNAQLRGEVDTQRRRLRSLEGQLLGANQKRQDVAKRIDELIAQIDHLDGEFDGARL